METVNGMKTYAARALNDISDFNVQVDLVIPFHGQYARVTELLESLFRLTRSNYYTVCLVDDCSPNAQYVETVKRNVAKTSQRKDIFQSIRSDKQRGFAASCQIGYEATNSPYVCFINSDCRIEDSNWLRAMGESLLRLKSEGVRMVSPTTNNPVGGDVAQYGEKFARAEDDVILTDDSYLTLYCFLCHRDLFPKCGGFLKPYPFGGYEDQEFATRMRHYGYKQAVCRSSWIYHEGEATFKNILRNNPAKVAEVSKNRQRCITDMKKYQR